MGNILLAAVTAALTFILAGSPVAGAITAVPTTADGFTGMFADKNDQTWSGGDQMTSFKAPNGKVYWISGDTMLSNGEDPDGSYPDMGTTMVSNRILMQDGGELVNAMANGGVAVPDPATHTVANQERYWTQGTFYANGYLYVLCQRVVSDTESGSSMGFKTIGVELAKFSIASSGKLTFLGMRSTPSSGVQGGAGPAATQWAGDAIVKDGYVYIYGYTLAANNPYVAHFSYVARVAPNKVETPSAWRYYKKTTNQWITSVSGLDADAANQRDALVASQISSVRVIGDKVVFVHKPWNGWGSSVYAEIGTAPQGPFTTKYLFDSPAGTWEGKNYQTYGPMLHPEQTLAGLEAGKILVSIDWNGIDFWTDTLGNADLYKPRFYAVPLP